MKSMKKISIRFILVISMLVVSLTSTLLFQVSYGSLTSQTFTQLDLQIINQNIEQVKTQLDSILTNVETMHTFIEESILAVTRLNRVVFEAQTKNMLGLDGELNAIMLLSKSGNIIGSQPTRLSNQLRTVADQEWFQQINAENGVQYSKPHIQRGTNGDYVWVATAIYPVAFFINGNSSGGYLCFDICISALKEACALSTLGNDGYLYITAADGTSIYSPRDKLETLADITPGYSPANDIATEDQHMEFSYQLINEDWSLTGIVRPTGMTGSSDSLRTQSLLLLLLSTVISVVLALLLSQLIVRPVVALEQTMNKLDDTTKDIRAVPSGPKEFISLANQYNDLLDRIDALLAESNEKQQLLREMELGALQDQVNPHFLYNTLDSVIWILEGNRTKDGIDMIEALAKLLRLSINKGGNYHTVEKELEHATNYLKIQAIKLGQRFTWEIDVQRRTQRLYCPRIILQPIIENAIKYGIANSSSAKVKIEVWTEDEHLLRMRVSDDGSGIEPGLLQRLQEQMRLGAAPETQNISGIGMKNVNRRIRLLCGTQYGLLISSELEEWTCVDYMLPIRRQP